MTHTLLSPSTHPTWPDSPPIKGLSTQSLQDLVLEIAAQPNRWEHAVRFDRAERHWARLAAPAGVDIWLLTWLRSQSTDLHDHGDSAAAFTVVRGAVTEIRPDTSGRLLPRTFSAGLVQQVEPGTIHDVRNERATPAVSIHAYSPPLTTMTYYAWSDGLALPTRSVRTSEPEEGP